MKFLKYILGVCESFNDESIIKANAESVNRASYPNKIWPKTNKYRVVEYELRDFHRFHLQALLNNKWIDVVVYDNGYDDYGQLHAGKWVKLGDDCNWTLRGIKRLGNELMGIPEIPMTYIPRKGGLND